MGGGGVIVIISRTLPFLPVPPFGKIGKREEVSQIQMKGKGAIVD